MPDFEIICPRCARVVGVHTGPDGPTMAQSNFMWRCPQCRKDVPHVNEFRCPICSTLCSDVLAHPSNCQVCGAYLLTIPLRPFQQWPDTPSPGGQQASEATAAAELGRLMPPLSVGGRAIEPTAVYPALAEAYDLYQSFLRDWSDDVVRENPRSISAVFEGKHPKNSAIGTSYRAKTRLFSQIWDVKEMQQLDGYDFEMVIAMLFLRMGYTVQLTPPRGDQGADLVVTDVRAARTAVQVKNSQYPLGNDAVQEVLGGMSYYGCSQGIVVTTSEFTSSAQKLATSHSGLSLWDVRKLGDLWAEHMLPKSDQEAV